MSREALERVLGWVREEAARLSSANPYFLAYRHADYPGLSLEDIDRVIREACGIALDDPRRVAFVAWVTLDEASRRGHTAVEASQVIERLRRACACTREGAVQGVTVGLHEGAFAGVRLGGVAYLQLAHAAAAEEDVAAFVSARVLASRIRAEARRRGKPLLRSQASALVAEAMQKVADSKKTPEKTANRDDED